MFSGEGKNMVIDLEQAAAVDNVEAGIARWQNFPASALTSPVCSKSITIFYPLPNT